MVFDRLQRPAIVIKIASTLNTLLTGQGLIGIINISDKGKKIKITKEQRFTFLKSYLKIVVPAQDKLSKWHGKLK